jgi:hypothetical protein
VYCRWARTGDDVKLRHIRAKMGCGDTPAPVRDDAPAPRPSGLARELVVCRYQEDLAWLDDVPAEIFVSLYDKSDAPFSVARPRRRVRLPNVGREAHSMLWHLANHYDALADWTYFVQGDAPFHAPDLLGRLEVDYADLTPLSETYSATHPPAFVHAEDRVDEVGGFRVAYGNALAGQGLQNWKPWADPAAWSAIFAGPRPDPMWFAYAAMWAVPRRRVRARPRAFWRWLLSEAERSLDRRDEWTDPPLTPWQFESLWYYLFSSPDEFPHRCDRLPPSAAEAFDLTARMKRCPYRSRGPGCGCSGANCALKGGGVVSHQQCFDCIRRYG